MKIYNWNHHKDICFVCVRTILTALYKKEWNRQAQGTFSLAISSGHTRVMAGVELHSVVKYNGRDIALKLTDLSKKKFLLPELLKKIEIYHFLADIQGLFIPGYGYMWGKMFFTIATTIVSKSLEHSITINRKQERNAYNAIMEIHRHNNDGP